MMQASAVIDFAQRTGRGRHLPPPRIKIEDALARVERCTAWLNKAGVNVLAHLGSTLTEPVVIVDNTPAAWMLFKGRAERIHTRQNGAIRDAVWEGYDRINHVRVRWLEVSACAT